MDVHFADGTTLRLLTGDITTIPVDAIVNAANAELRGGGGVDGAIHRAGGPGLMKELDAIRGKIGRCPPGHAVVTGAGKLPAQYVFHAVGPIYQDGKHGESEALSSCYRECLKLAEEHGLGSISFPAISTGVYGYPVEAAARVAMTAIAEHLRKPGHRVQQVLLVLFGKSAYDVHARVAGELE